MLIRNRALRLVVISLLALVLIPLLLMLGMMTFGGAMMAQMGGMQMSTAGMALCALWTVLVAAALIFLIVLLIRGVENTGRRGVHQPT